MEPRLKNSTKWTPFPEELSEQIQEVFSEHLADYDGADRGFSVEGRIYSNEILMRVGLEAPKGQLRQDNFECSYEYDSQKQKPIDLIHLMSDFLAETWTMFFEDTPEIEDLPRHWAPHVFEKQSLYLRYSSVNTNLEQQADMLLNGIDKKLVYGEDELIADTDLSDEETLIEPDNFADESASNEPNDQENSLH